MMDIFTAIAQGRVRQIGHILQDSDNSLTTTTHDGKTALIYAVCEAKDEIRTHLVRMLLKQGSDVNAIDENRRTALMYASMDNDKLDLVRVLARCKGCDPNIKDNEGNTAIMHAIMCANAAAIKVLVNASVTKSTINLELTNAQGLTALEMSVKLQMPECCKVLVCEGGANTKQVNNQVGLMRLLEDENLFQRNNTPHSRHPSRNAFVNRKLDSPILENKQFEGSYMSRDTTPNYVDDFPGRGTPYTALSRSNSLHRSNSNLYKRRPEAGSRPSSLSFAKDVLGILNSQKSLKRVLTPISGRNGTPVITRAEISEDSIGNRTRLPSIPSGRKLFLVSSKNKFNGYTNSDT
ncbi:putative ankyrin repeat domain-containing protein 30B-like [Ruditapes philippinarum]|uniref:putative ankyrin repeat domain-containing protein 30B-like n=1 Tax=Ruditapes philippinarum TaxID=129788 RepID=UPI00295A91A7|nr:putative ankyrin repeat domain-containing protein 30B-like [Ruditapes philippinarum]